MKCIDPSHSQKKLGTLHFIGFSYRTEKKWSALTNFSTCNLTCLFLESSNPVIKNGSGTPFCKFLLMQKKKIKNMFRKTFLMKWSVPTFDSIYRPLLIFLHSHMISLLFNVFHHFFCVFSFLCFSSLFCIAK